MLYAALLSLIAFTGPQLGAARPPKQATPFTYTAPKPVNGHLAGVIELGSTGLNSFVVTLDEQRNWQLEKATYGRSYVAENQADPATILKQVQQYAAQQQAAGVPQGTIRVVVSSGAAQAQVTQRLLETLRTAGYAAVMLTPEQEGQCAVAAVLPVGYANRVFVADISTSKTKLSWVKDKDHTTTITTYGSNFYTNKEVPLATVLADVRTQAQKVPTKQRQLCLLLGGAPYQLAQATAGNTRRYVPLPAPASLPTLTEPQAQAGQQLYKAIAEGSGCQQFVFVNEASFAIGYLLLQEFFK